MVVVAAGGTAAGSYRNKMAGPRCRVDARSSRDARTSIPSGAKRAIYLSPSFSTASSHACFRALLRHNGLHIDRLSDGSFFTAAPTGAVVQGYAPPPPQAAQAVGTTVAPPPYTPPPQTVQAEVVAAAPMDRK